MPPKRTRTPATSSKTSQKPLTFSSKVVKPTSTSSSTSLKEKLAFSPLPSSSSSPENKDTGHLTSSAVVAEQARKELKGVKRTEEEKARRITDAQIRKYWKEREGERICGRVHQGDLGVEEKILRYWDCCSWFGPCIGVARMKRWVRANKLGLNPPIEVLAVLLKEEDKGNGKIERAYMDELMSSKFVVGEA